MNLIYTTKIDEDGLTIIPHLGYLLTFGKRHYYFKYRDIKSVNVKIIKGGGRLGFLSAVSKITIKTKEKKYVYMPSAGYTTDELLLLAALKKKLKNKFNS